MSATIHRPQITRRRIILLVLAAVVLVLTAGAIIYIANQRPQVIDYNSALTAETKSAMGKYHRVITGGINTIARSYYQDSYAVAEVSYHNIGPEGILKQLPAGSYRNQQTARPGEAFTVEVTQAGFVKLISMPLVSNVLISPIVK